LGPKPTAARGEPWWTQSLTASRVPPKDVEREVEEMNDMIKMEGGQEAISVKNDSFVDWSKVLIPKVKKSEM
jgi:hypothetical protein